MFKWLQKYLQEDSKYSSTRLVYIWFAFLTMLIVFSIIVIAFWFRDVNLIDALTTLVTLILSATGLTKVVQKKFENGKSDLSINKETNGQDK